jgi:hypothetical protein
LSVATSSKPKAVLISKQQLFCPGYLLSQAKRAGGEPKAKIESSIARFNRAKLISLVILEIWVRGIFL